ncbi:hypothetical protein FA95DRAFT_1602173 [Auriscalpium vulgare]|uniref:Uncharacterized protein n=1 Tax=Auriscalpium vulgare TaxID=40419 RepID=A0ACB8S8F7_9AGAM|nr:hypothetical protein FA95DRAFT_1602173 [Auriscalpium vulgare]
MTAQRPLFFFTSSFESLTLSSDMSSSSSAFSDSPSSLLAYPSTVPVNPAHSPPPGLLHIPPYSSHPSPPLNVPEDETLFGGIDPALLTNSPVPALVPASAAPAPAPPPPHMPDLWHASHELVISLTRIDNKALTSKCYESHKVRAAVRLFLNFLSLFPDPVLLMSVASHILYANETRLESLAGRLCRPASPDNVCPPLHAASQINSVILTLLNTPEKVYHAQDCNRLTFRPIKFTHPLLPDAHLRLRVGSICTLLKPIPHRDLPLHTIVVVVRVGEVSVTVKVLHDPTPIIVCRTDFEFYQRGERCSFRRRQIPLQLAYQRHYRRILSTAELTKKGMEDLPLTGEDIHDDGIALVDDIDVYWSDSSSEDSDSYPPPLEPITPPA